MCCLAVSRYITATHTPAGKVDNRHTPSLNYAAAQTTQNPSQRRQKPSGNSAFQKLDAFQLAVSAPKDSMLAKHHSTADKPGLGIKSQAIPPDFQAPAKEMASKNLEE